MGIYSIMNNEDWGKYLFPFKLNWPSLNRAKSVAVRISWYERLVLKAIF